MAWRGCATKRRCAYHRENTVMSFPMTSEHNYIEELVFMITVSPKCYKGSRPVKLLNLMNWFRQWRLAHAGSPNVLLSWKSCGKSCEQVSPLVNSLLVYQFHKPAQVFWLLSHQQSLSNGNPSVSIVTSSSIRQYLPVLSKPTSSRDYGSSSSFMIYHDDSTARLFRESC